jgi:hypothetical protein
MNKPQAIWYFHQLRQNIPFTMVKDGFGDWDWQPRGYDMFFFDCLQALHSLSDAGVEEFLEILNAQEHFNDPVKCYKKYNSSKSPVRNFLIRCYIDYPLE